MLTKHMTKLIEKLTKKGKNDQPVTNINIFKLIY